jgi:DNA phosphorothioation-dependent restriction protein DptH
LDRLIEEIARRIRAHVGAAATNLLRADGEIRSVFHGPPMEFLESVFERLVADGGIEVELGNGQPVTVPVLLQVNPLSATDPNPPLGESGRCDAIHLLEVRNSPGRCPRFIALAEPGGQSSLSFTSASDDFGLSPHNNSGAASTGDWWRDEFVRQLVKGALDRHQWPSPGEREDAHDLIESAVQAADQIDKHVASRYAAWRVLARTWSIGEPGTPFGTLLSLACGFPPTEDGSVDLAAQRKVLLAITERFVDSGFKPAVEQLKERGDAKDNAALDELLLYLQHKCGVPTVLSRAPAFYYGPSDAAKLDPAPGWWTVLTVEKWRHLLDGAEQAAPTGKALRLECHNPLLSSLGGASPIVVNTDVVLSVHNNGNVNAPSRVTIERKSARSPTREWELEVTGDGTVVDPDKVPGSAYCLADTNIPPHSTPMRYAARSFAASLAAGTGGLFKDSSEARSSKAGA